MTTSDAQQQRQEQHDHDDDDGIASLSSSSSNHMNTDHRTNATQGINSAYEALETMRKLNLELQCNANGVLYDDACCTTCLLSEKFGTSNVARFPRLSKWALQLQQQQQQQEIVADDCVDTKETSSIAPTAGEEKEKNGYETNDNNEKEIAPSTDTSTATTTSRFPRISKFIHSERKRPKSPPCLICGTLVCKQHASPDFSAEGVTVCLECQHLFGLQFVIDFLTEPQHDKRKQSLDHLLDVYDRVVLLLTYSSQYIPTVAEQLEQSKQRQNKIGLGSSSVGMVSGALGIAAAATILTPVGPPLLVASLLFGGGSTAVQTGSDAMHYYSEPQQLAKRILALHSMLWNILHITSILRDAMMREHVRSDFYQDDPSAHSHFSDPEFQQALDQKKSVMLSAAGLTSLGRCTAVSAEMGSQAGSQGARWMTRTSMNLMRGARAMRFAGGAMSAALMVLEVKNISNTVQSIRSGSPCDQAQQLRVIYEELVSKEKSIPDTSSLDKELHRYLTIVNQRERIWTQEQVAQIILEQNEQVCREEELLEQLKVEQQQPVESHVICDEDLSSTTGSSTTTASSRNENLSLLQRIALFKQKQKNPERVEPHTEEQEEVSDRHASESLPVENGMG
ncbi:hypothetical protein FisN_18Hh264 [Fistulifera solaris]|uniref:Uncharacterized protein n=1 Tax=Fistulifera solaris TaxID=1519565 RepID=A0A1Z5KJM5_FISSO|nr:hypothetical protein FisN_18Hh264 [Fistulifera solaris]|eukprot:GAX26148.1 hypothetical protein FisN_18Hh264 [Fistulifera solaris]